MRRDNPMLISTEGLSAIVRRHSSMAWLDGALIGDGPPLLPSLPSSDLPVMYDVANGRRGYRIRLPVLTPPPGIGLSECYVIDDLPGFSGTLLRATSVDGLLTPLQRHDLGELLTIAFCNSDVLDRHTTAQGVLKALIREMPAATTERRSRASVIWHAFWGNADPPITPHIALQCAEFAACVADEALECLIRSAALGVRISNAQAIEATHGVSTELQANLLRHPMRIRTLRAWKRRMQV